jgi:drug/metabolite transporter (DMT)-like permease
MNSTTPLFGALFALIWLNEKMTFQKAAGFALGTSGVVLIALKSSHGATPSNLEFDAMTLMAAGAGLIAAACYAAAGVYMKRYAQGIRPFSMAGMSHLIGGLVLFPFALLAWNQHPQPLEALMTSRIVSALFCLSIICSALGFMIFYHLVERVGPTQTLVVGYLIPAFGILWGSLFLHEPVQPEMIVGTLLILGAVAVISMKRRSLNASKEFEKTELAPIISKELAIEAANKKTSEVS